LYLRKKKPDLEETSIIVENSSKNLIEKKYNAEKMWGGKSLKPKVERNKQLVVLILT